MVKLSIRIYLIEFIRKKNEHFFLRFVQLLSGEASDSPQFGLELLFYSGFFFF